MPSVELPAPADHDRICPRCHAKTSELLCPRDAYPTVDVAALAGRDPKGLVGEVFETRFRIDAPIRLTPIKP